MTARALLVLLALAVAGAVGPGTARAAGGLTVELFPGTVSVQPGRPTSFLLIVRNAGPATGPVQVGALDATPVRVSPASLPPLPRLGAGAEHAWSLSAGLPAGSTGGQVLFRVDYSVGGSPRVATASLAVQGSAAGTPANVADVDVKTTLASLDSDHPGVVYLVVTNKLDVPLTVRGVTGHGPSFVTFSRLAHPVTIAPRAQTPVEVDVSSQSRVQPGTYLLLFTTAFSWPDGSGLAHARVVSSQQTKVGIPGESAVLTLLGVPSFLLIPGFLIVVAISMLWQFGLFRRRAATSTFPLELSKPPFWVVAVTLSIGVAALYPHLPHTGGVDYLKAAYGLRDVVVIWLLSLGIGVVGYLLIVLIAAAAHRYVAWRTPTSDDDPSEVIAKLGRQWLGLQRPRYVFGTGAGAYTRYLVQRRPADGQGAWLAPLVNVTVNDSVADGAALLQQLQQTRSAWKLARTLRKRHADVTVSWGADAGPDHPDLRANADLTAAAQQSAARFVWSS